jgi:serine-type D-Ala-D-Ala carboxypeptidase/endopeptidase (penicillin-binding protein 4)
VAPALREGRGANATAAPSTIPRVRMTVGLIASAMALALLGAAPAAGGQLSDANTPDPLSSDSFAPDLPASTSARAGAAEAEAASIDRDKLRRRLAKLARQAPGKSSLFVVDPSHRGKQGALFKHKGGKRRKLASNTKLFTTATALHRLGGEARIVTRVKHRGSIGEWGVLAGDLYLIGGGDPALDGPDLTELARELHDGGLRRVKGKLLADDSVFDRRRGVPDSNWGPSPYIRPLAGLVHGGSTYSGDPARAAAQAFRSALKRAGIRVKGGVELGKLPGRLREREALAETGSPPIASLVASTNKPSNNFFAEMLLKRLWAAPGRQGTTRGGTRAVQRFARSLGSGIRARDGSGLTDGNKASAREVATLLARMRDHRESRQFFASLAVAGREGTVAGRMQGTAAAGRCRAKTGTISGVSALSGYCGKGERTVAFSLLMNGVGNVDAVRNLQDRMAAEIARYRP